MAVLEAVVARTGRVCPLECDGDKVESNGKCVPKASKAKNLEASKGANKGATARAKPRAERQSAQAPNQPAYDPRAEAGAGRGGGRVDVDAAGWAKQSDRAANRASKNV
jgi:hypothetical protein